MTQLKLFKSIIRNMYKIYRKKNHDYGNSFFDMMDEDGPIYLKGKIGDKYYRFKTLINTPNQVKDESLVDTLLDMANYCILGIMWYKINATVHREKFYSDSKKKWLHLRKNKG